MNALGLHRKIARRPQRSGHGVACAPSAESASAATPKARQRARPWAVHGQTERANVVVTTHRQPEAASAIARIGG